MSLTDFILDLTAKCEPIKGETDYWQSRCLAAEEALDGVVFDLNLSITSEAYNKWQEIKNQVK